jgi:hypothetical protein
VQLPDGYGPLPDDLALALFLVLYLKQEESD